MLIKASCVTNLTDARYFAAKEVQYLGFNLEEGTPSYLDPMYMKAIREWVEGPKIVGEFLHASPAYAAEAAAFLGLDAIQLNAAGHLDELQQLAGVETILRVDGSLESPVIEQIFHGGSAFVDCFLLDFSGVSDWESVLLDQKDWWNGLFELRPTLLQADFTASNLPALLDAFKLGGLSLIGGAEEQVGVKSFDELDEIFELMAND